MALAKKARVARPAKKTPRTKAPATKPARGRKAAAAKTPRPGLPVAASKAPPSSLPASASMAKAADDKPKRAKLVRDSFTIPKAEYAVLQDLKQRCAKLGRPAKKSEVLRAGINALAAMGDAAFSGAMATVPALKTGRPSKA